MLQTVLICAMTINMRGETGDKEKKEAAQMGFSEDHGHRYPCAAARQSLVNLIIENASPSVVFAQELGGAFHRLSSLTFESNTSQSEAGIAWKPSEYLYIQTIDEGEKDETLKKLFRRRDYGFVHGRSCMVILKHQASHARVLFVSWHGKHIANDETKAFDFRTLQTLVTHLQKKHRCHAAIIGGDFNFKKMKAKNHVGDYIMTEPETMFQLFKKPGVPTKDKDDFFLWRASDSVKLAVQSAYKVDTGCSSSLLDHYPAVADFSFQELQLTDPVAAAQVPGIPPLRHPWVLHIPNPAPYTTARHGALLEPPKPCFSSDKPATSNPPARALASTAHSTKKLSRETLPNYQIAGDCSFPHVPPPRAPTAQAGSTGQVPSSSTWSKVKGKQDRARSESDKSVLGHKMASQESSSNGRLLVLYSKDLRAYGVSQTTRCPKQRLEELRKESKLSDLQLVFETECKGSEKSAAVSIFKNMGLEKVPNKRNWFKGSSSLRDHIVGSILDEVRDSLGV